MVYFQARRFLTSSVSSSTFETRALVKKPLNNVGCVISLLWPTGWMLAGSWMVITHVCTSVSCVTCFWTLHTLCKIRKSQNASALCVNNRACFSEECWRRMDEWVLGEQFKCTTSLETLEKNPSKATDGNPEDSRRWLCSKSHLDSKSSRSLVFYLLFERNIMCPWSKEVGRILLWINS